MTQPATNPMTPAQLMTLATNVASAAKALHVAQQAAATAREAWRTAAVSSGVESPGRHVPPSGQSAGALPDFNTLAATLLSAQTAEATARESHKTAKAAHDAAVASLA